MSSQGRCHAIDPSYGCTCDLDCLCRVSGCFPLGLKKVNVLKGVGYFAFAVCFCVSARSFDMLSHVLFAQMICSRP